MCSTVFDRFLNFYIGLVSDDLLIETPNMVKALGRLDPATKLAR